MLKSAGIPIPTERLMLLYSAKLATPYSGLAIAGDSCLQHVIRARAPALVVDDMGCLVNAERSGEIGRSQPVHHALMVECKLCTRFLLVRQ
jgi:hypothetical protein